jgi:hypothetical protein
MKNWIIKWDKINCIQKFDDKKYIINKYIR